MQHKDLELVVFDFDGTLTKHDGQHTVSHPAYGRVTANDYQTMMAQTLNEEMAIERREKILGKINRQKNKDLFELAYGGAEYLKALIKDENKIVLINSKNVKEYIGAVLRHNDFSNADLNGLPIIDVRDFRELPYVKGSAVKQFINSLPEETRSSITSVKIYEDSEDDCNDMWLIAKQCLGKRCKIETIIKQPGKFHYDEMVNKEYGVTEFKGIKPVEPKINSILTQAFDDFSVFGLDLGDDENAKANNPPAVKAAEEKQ